MYSSTIRLIVYYPEDNINKEFIDSSAGVLFGLSITACQTERGLVDSDGTCPGGTYASDKSLSISNITDRVGPNHWEKTLDMGTIYTGKVYVRIVALISLGVEGDRYTVDSSIPQCIDQAGNYEITVEYCEQPGSPYSVDISDVNQEAVLYTFPWFGLDEGMIIGASDNTELAHVYSPQLDNYRNISVFVPQSILQNTVPRAVNIMMMMDGEYGVVSAFVNRGGFDLAVSTGVAPESIMIGVPSTPDIFSAVDPSDRTYELTFNICNPALMDCNPATSGYNVDNTGGTDLLLSFMSDNVIPLVLDIIGMQQGEVSIAGASLGGLTSLYAVATRPLTYARAFSLEGNTPYNWGQVADFIIGNYSLHGNRPKAVVMQMGTSAYSDFTNPTTGEIQNEMDFHMVVLEAFESIGMSKVPAQCQNVTAASSVNEYASATACDAPDSIVTLFSTINGQHSIQTWSTIFSLGLPALYSADFPSVNKTAEQRIYVQQFLSYSSSSSSTDSLSGGAIASIVLACLLGLALLVIIYLVMAMQSTSPPMSSSEEASKA